MCFIYPEELLGKYKRQIVIQSGANSVGNCLKYLDSIAFLYQKNDISIEQPSYFIG